MNHIQLYMVIDTTVVEETKILYVAEIRPAMLWGRLLSDKGRKVIAPAIEGRGFTKLPQLALQYLFWNTFGTTPSDNYAQLVQDCVIHAKLMAVDQTDLNWLEREAEKIEVKQSAEAPRIGDDGLAVPIRPRTAGATQQVWEIADKLCGPTPEDMPERKAIIDACIAQGINPATASTQYSKWKKARLGA